MPSAHEHPQVVTEYIAKELSLGHLLGPFPESIVIPGLHLNSFGVIPKGHNLGKWRLIVDLSSPPAEIVNYGIESDLCSLSYITVDRVAEIVVRLGVVALMAKVDVESTFRLILVHPQDRPLLGMSWEGRVYIDPQLPFGLRSAPKLFNAVADTLNWCFYQRSIPHVLCYLDDFIIIGSLNRPCAKQSLIRLQATCTELRVPIAPHKTEGPCSCLVYLGIEMDTLAGQLCFPANKLSRLQACLKDWQASRACHHRDLESLIGLLNHACMVVRAGQTFFRRMIDLLHARCSPRHNTHIRLNVGFHSDLTLLGLLCKQLEWQIIPAYTRLSASGGDGFRRIGSMGMWCMVQ